jgi:hypothetical protein
MPCIHGLDENNCPTCRISKAALPKTPLNIDSRQNEIIKTEHPLFGNKGNKSNQYIDDLNLKRSPLIPESVSKPSMITDLPNFENKMFLDRLNEIDISKSDTFGFSKRIPLGSSKLILKKED